MLIALACAFALSQAFRTLGAMMATPLISAYGLSARQLGLWSSAFHLGFGLLQITMGLSLDLYGVRRTVLCAFPMAVGGAALCAFAPGFGALVLGQALIGIGCAPAFLACTVFIARHFAAERFTAMSGLAMSISGLGILFTGTPLAWLIEAFSWRAGYVALGGVALLAWLAVYWRVREPAPPRPAQDDATGGGARPSLRQALREMLPLLRLPHTRGILCFAAVSYAAFITLRGLWLGPMLHDRHALSLVASGNVALAMTLTGIVGPSLFGRLDPGRARRPRWMAACAGLGAALFAVMALTGHLWIDIVLPVFYGLLSGYNVLQYAYVKSSYPAAVTGRAIALLNTAMFLGVALMQWLTGAVATWAAQQGIEPLRAAFLTVAAMLAAGALAFARMPQARTAPAMPAP